jgi:hypothetical protein
MAPVEIQAKLHALRARLRAFFVIDGLSRVAAVAVAVVSASILFDWLTSPKLPIFMRWGLLLSGLSAIGWVLWKRLVSPMRIKLGEDDMAIAVERANPGLRDSLISSVQLARAEAAPGFGASREMVGKLVSTTSAATAAMDFRSAVDARALRGQLAAGSLATLFALAITAMAPESVLTGLTRYFAPFSGAQWQARTELQFGQLPLLLAKGDNLDLEVSQRGYQRSRGAIYYRDAGHTGPWQHLDVRADEKGLLRSRLSRLSGSIELYAQAGDGTTALRTVEVVDRPEVEQVTLCYTYPLYTGLQPENGPTGNGQARALQGTRVRVRVRFSCPASRAVLKSPDADIQMFIDTGKDARFAVGEFVIRAGGFYRIAPETDYLRTDARGTKRRMTFTAANPAKFSITALKDKPPEVKISNPGADINVRPVAVIPLRALARDDFAVASAQISYGLSTRTGEEQLALASARFGSTRVALGHQWDLAPLKLKPGTAVSYCVRARDRRAKPGPNVGSSEVYHLRVVSDAEFDAETVSIKNRIRRGIKELVRLEETNQQQVGDIRTRLTAGGRFDRNARYKTTLAEGEQRAIARRTGTLGHAVQALRRRQTMNRADDASEDRQLGQMSGELGRLEREEMPKAAEAIRAGRQAGRKADATGHLGKATNRQQKIIATLDKLLKTTNKWKQTDALLKMARALLTKEQVIATDTLSAARSGEFRGKHLTGLEARIKNKVEFLRREQNAAATDMSELEERMIVVLGRLSDPASRSRVTAALRVARDVEATRNAPVAAQAEGRPLREVMSAAAAKIAALRLGSAADEQKLAVGALQRIVRALSSSGKRDHDQILRDLHGARNLAVKTRDQEAGHIKDTKAAAGNPGQQKPGAEEKPSSKAPGTRSPKQIGGEQEKTRELAEELRKLLERAKARHDLPRLKKPIAGTGSARTSMKRAAGKLSSGKPGEALPDEDDALQKMKEVIRDIDNEIAKVDNDQRQGELFKIEKQLREILAVHLRVIAKTLEVQGFRKSNPTKQLGRPQIRRLVEAAREETAIMGRVRATVKRLADCPIFRWVLDDIAGDMQEVRGELDKRRTGQYVQEVERDVKRQLEELIAALKKERQKAAKRPPEPPRPPGSGNPPPPGKPPLVPPLAELKMLRILQAQVNRRTKWVDRMVARRPDRKLTSTLRRYLERTAQKQGDIARLTQELARGPSRKAR